MQLVTGLRSSAGESGAWCTQADDGRLFTLKLHRSSEHLKRFRNAEHVTNQLRSLGYPVPEHLGSGLCPAGAWQLIEWIPGESLQRPDIFMLEELFALVSIQRLSRNRSPVWTDEMVDSVLNGKNGYCQIASLDQYCQRSRRLLSTIQQWAAAAKNFMSRSDDLVHFDFHPGNILFERDKVRAVIDWDGTRWGDAAFDLVTLLFYCYDEPQLATRILAEIQEQIPKELLRLYMAHIILRQVDWSIRHHDASTIVSYLTRSELIIRDLTAR